MQVANVVLSFILISSIIFLFYKNLKLSYKNTELMEIIIKSYLENSILSSHIETKISNPETENKKDDEGFLKFISESREHAFKYIEESQKVIKDFVRYIDNNIEYLKSDQPKDLKYKTVIRGIENYSNKLKNLLPKDE